MWPSILIIIFLSIETAAIYDCDKFYGFFNMFFLVFVWSYTIYGIKGVVVAVFFLLKLLGDAISARCFGAFN